MRHIEHTHIIRLIDQLASARRRSPHTVGFWVSGSGDFYARMKNGHDITTRRAARITQWLSDHWPVDLDWPSDIPRPAPSVPVSDPQEAA